MTAAVHSLENLSPQEYKRRIWAWTMYDWANSAFATTILAAVLPIYFSQVAGATLPSATVATAYWSTGLSLSLFFIAMISPILGTISDLMRGKKRFLSLFAGIGIVSTALLVLVGTGDWILASILGIIGRIGFSGANTFYDALLPHVAKEEDRDLVSARGYAMGYLGGGILLAINIVMIQMLPGTWGARVSFLSVAIWWAIFTIPLLRRVPEPPAATMTLKNGENVVSASFKRIGETLSQIRRYRELFKYLIAFLIYNDGIGTIIGVAAIYGAELGFGATELILALLLVQFVAIPYSLIFGRLPSPDEKRRPFFLAFIVFNIIALPIVGIAGSRLLPADLSGSRPAPYASTAQYLGEGAYGATAEALRYQGEWQPVQIPAKTLGTDQDLTLQVSNDPNAAYELPFNGQRVRLTFSQGPEHGKWAVFIDDQPAADPDTQGPLVIDAYNRTERYDANVTIRAKTPGEHILRIANSGERNPESQGVQITLATAEVLSPERQSNLGLVIGMVLVAVLVCLWCWESHSSQVLWVS
jgi:UMF1 family MFS transporter